MKNITEVLRAKEEQILRVKIEIEALRIAAPLLTDQIPPNRDNGAGQRQVIEMP
jgi:hypothetical protein